MKIMISACLAGENCKYNGGNNRNEKVLHLMAENEVIKVCPEQMGGLPTPRKRKTVRLFPTLIFVAYSKKPKKLIVF